MGHYLELLVMFCPCRNYFSKVNIYYLGRFKNNNEEDKSKFNLALLAC